MKRCETCKYCKQLTWTDFATGTTHVRFACNRDARFTHDTFHSSKCNYWEGENDEVQPEQR